MRSDEFVNVDEMATPAQRKHITKTKWEAPKEIKQWLKGKNFKKIDKGYFSAVYRRPGSNKVVKISNKQDDCYIKFAKHVKKNPNKYFPRVYEFIEYKNEQKGRMFITVLEYLRTIPFKKIDWSTTENRYLLAYLFAEGWIHSGDKVINQIMTDQFGDGPWYTNDQIHNMMQELDSSTSELAEAIRTIDGMGCDFDFHEGNIMYRKSDKSVVIIDPYID